MDAARTIPRPARAAGVALVAGALGAVLWCSPAASAAPPPGGWLIVDRGATGVTTVAGFRLPAAARARGADGPLLRDLIRAWGRPADTRAFGRVGCRVTWASPRVQVTVANFGAAPAGAGACRPNVGKLQEIRTLGRSWRTRWGLRVGHSRARLRAIHPTAAPAVDGDPHVLMLSPELYPCARCSGPQQLAASRRGAVNAVIPPGARVQRFTVWVGAAGD